MGCGYKDGESVGMSGATTVQALRGGWVDAAGLLTWCDRQCRCTMAVGQVYRTGLGLGGGWEREAMCGVRDGAVRNGCGVKKRTESDGECGWSVRLGHSRRDSHVLPPSSRLIEGRALVCEDRPLATPTAEGPLHQPPLLPSLWLTYAAHCTHPMHICALDHSLPLWWNKRPDRGMGTPLCSLQLAPAVARMTPHRRS